LLQGLQCVDSYSTSSLYHSRIYSSILLITLLSSMLMNRIMHEPNNDALTDRHLFPSTLSCYINVPYNGIWALVFIPQLRPFVAQNIISIDHSGPINRSHTPG